MALFQRTARNSTSDRPFPIPSRRNGAIVVLQLGAILGCLYTARFALNTWQLLLLAAGFGILMNSVYSIIHEAEHAMLFHNRLLNDSVGVLMAVFFPAPFHLIRQGHIGHHMRNRSDDEAFDHYFEGDNKVWKFLVMYGVLTGFYWLLVALSSVLILCFPFLMDKKHYRFDRPSQAFMEVLNPRYTRWIQLESALVIAVHVLMVWGWHIPISHYVVVYIGFGFLWSAMQYVHHYGTERHVLKGARNLFVWGPLDRLWLNHNWHRTHHERPTIPWIYLPKLEQPAQNKRGFLPWAYLKMWKGPRFTREHVENKYAGRIIRMKGHW